MARFNSLSFIPPTARDRIDFAIEQLAHDTVRESGEYRLLLEAEKDRMRGQLAQTPEADNQPPARVENWSACMSTPVNAKPTMIPQRTKGMKEM